MAFKISGITKKFYVKRKQKKIQTVQRIMAPKKSVVKVYFSSSGKQLYYYNDQFELHNGDMVYVEGTMEGQCGRVIEVSYHFKIKLSDYQRVIAVIDTNVHGRFFMAGSHLVTFDPVVLPSEKARMWFLPPTKEDEEIVSSNDGSSFELEDLSGMQITHAVAERGQNYYMENRVRYLSIDDTKGYAIVEGSECYEVEFVYHDGEISNLLCSCPCTYHCKHEFAAMMQLRGTLDLIAKHYENQYVEGGYFAAVNKSTLFAFAVDGKETGEFIL